MKFEEALEQMRKGKAVTRPDYMRYVITIKSGIIQMIYFRNDEFYDRYPYKEIETLNCKDIIADDWEIVAKPEDWYRSKGELK